MENRSERFIAFLCKLDDYWEIDEVLLSPSKDEIKVVVSPYVGCKKWHVVGRETSNSSGAKKSNHVRRQSVRAVPNSIAGR